MKASEFFKGLMFGAAVGAATVLLLTPQSGEDLKQQIRDAANLVLEEGKRAAAERRAELEAQFAQSKQTPLHA